MSYQTLCAKNGNSYVGKSKKNVEFVLLSHSIMQSQIIEMSKDILKQVISDIKPSSTKISLQLDISIDVSNCSQFIALVRHLNGSATVKNSCFWKS